MRFRLSALVGAVIFTAVMSTAAFDAWRGFERQVENQRNLLSGAASAYAAGVAEPVADGARRDAVAMLKGVRDLPGVIQSDIRLTDGSVFVQLGTGALLLGRDGDPTAMSNRELWAARQLRVEMPILNGGEQIATLGLLADITDLRAAVVESLRLTALSALIAILICVAMAQWVIARMTRPLRQLSAMMAAFGDDQAATMDRVKAGRDETGVLAEAFNTMIASIKDRDARIANHMATLEDTVDARTRDLRRARDEAEAANAAKSDFLATMSHEIRTPMNGMLVMAEMLSSADLSARHRRYADIIARSGKSLLTIINDILDLSKIESGKLDLEAAPVSLDALVCDSASLFWERAREKGLEIATYVSPAVPRSVIADPTRLNQIITNLVNNALKFTETGGVEIRVDAAQGADEGAVRLKIEVEDTGIGIPDDKAAQIFEAFSQADQTTTRRFGGTGLGLAVCRRLVEAMGGEISVRSTVGEGSVFSVVFEAAVDQAAPEAPASGPAISVALGAGLTARALERALIDAGCEVKDTEAPVTVGDSRSIAEAGAPVRIVLNDIGDGRADELLRSGLAADLLPNPYTRADLAALTERLRTNTLRGAAALSDKQPLEALPTFEGLRVLAADDNAVNREVLREALSTLNVGVVFAENGAEAVEYAGAETFDAIFMDGAMPVLDGFEATRRIRAEENRRGASHTPIYALTAQVAGAGDAAWTEAGADGVVTKPFTLDRLASVLSGLSVPKTTKTCLAPPAPSGPDLFDAATLAEMKAMSARSGRDVRSRVWALFEDKAPDALQALAESVASGVDSADIASCAHALKSMALSAGAAQVASLCQTIEHAATDQHSTIDLKEHVQTLGTCMLETLTAMSDKAAA